MLRRRHFLWAGSAGLGGLLLPRKASAEQLVEILSRPANFATPIDSLASLVTPTPLFFVRNHFSVPAPDRQRPLRIGGLVRTPLELTVEQLRSFPQVTVTCVL